MKHGTLESLRAEENAKYVAQHGDLAWRALRLDNPKTPEAKTRRAEIEKRLKYYESRTPD